MLVTYPSYESLQLSFLSNSSNNPEPKLQVILYFNLSPWYSEILYVLQNLQDPPGLRKTRARSVKLKEDRFHVMNQYLYWKVLGGILLNCLLDNEAQHTMK